MFEESAEQRGTGIALAACRAGKYKAVFLTHPGASAEIRDFTVFASDRQPLNETVARFFWEDNALHIHADCFYAVPGKVNAENTDDGLAVWDGDELEFFFGAETPEVHQRQLCVGAGGGRFDCCGRYDEWRSEVSVEKNAWHADIFLPFSMLRLKGMKTLLNIGRQTLYGPEYVSWCSVTTGFGEMKEFGDLFFCSPDQAYFLLSGMMPEMPLDKDSFVKLAVSKSVSCGKVSDYPVLLQPNENNLNVLWRTFGSCAAALEYREKGGSEWKRVYSGWKHGLLDQRKRIHCSELKNLEYGAEYEYRLLSFFNSKRIPPLVYPENGFCEFSVPPREDAPFSFLMISDIHSQTLLLEKWMQFGKESDFIIALGDFLAPLPCADNFYSGFLSEYGKRNPRQPVLALIGNHEQDGMYAADHEIFSFSSGKTYACFRRGDVCFLALNSGDVHPDGFDNEIRINRLLLNEEAEWLQEVIHSEKWNSAALRIILVHIPPYSKKKFDGQKVLRLLEPLGKAENKPDLALCGHLHEYGRLEGGMLKTPVMKAHSQLSEPEDIPDLPYPVICNSNDTAVAAEYSCGKLILRVFGKDGNTVDAIEIKSKKLKE